MKLLLRITTLLGLLFCAALIAHQGVQPIAALLARAGWMLLWLLPLHVLPLLLDALGWRVLLRALSVPARATAVPILLWIASVREAVNRLLPVANIGGEIVGIRMLALTGTDMAPAAASVIVEVLLTLVSQLLFAALGVLCLLQLRQRPDFAAAALMGLGSAAVLIAAVYALLRYGSAFQRLRCLIERMLELPARLRELLRHAAAMDAAIGQLCARRAALAATIGWQLTGLLAGTLETWLALALLAHPVSFAAALALEALTQAVRHFVFVVPAGLGVQEAGLVGFGYLLGLAGDTSIALSIVKRLREVLFGVPALLSWQLMEGWKGLGHVGSSRS